MDSHVLSNSCNAEKAVLRLALLGSVSFFVLMIDMTQTLDNRFNLESNH
jgi:hypothetical protein